MTRLSIACLRALSAGTALEPSVNLSAVLDRLGAGLALEPL